MEAAAASIAQRRAHRDHRCAFSTAVVALAAIVVCSGAATFADAQLQPPTTPCVWRASEGRCTWNLMYPFSALPADYLPTPALHEGAR